MNITVLCSDPRHPINPFLERWCEIRSSEHSLTLLNTLSNLPGGDILFAISCSEILRSVHRAQYRYSLVIHASALPERRGWSPHMWAILEGETHITVSLLTADDPVDSGLIYHQNSFEVPNYLTLLEINEALFKAELALMDWAVDNIDNAVPYHQTGDPTYCRKRTPVDSMLDPAQPIDSQFDILRIADSERFPAYFDLRGHRYTLALKLQGPTPDEN